MKLLFALKLLFIGLGVAALALFMSEAVSAHGGRRPRRH